MAAIARHLTRGPAKAVGSASLLDRIVCRASERRRGVSGEQSFCENVDRGIGFRHGDASCCGSRERSVASLRSTSAGESVVPDRTKGENLRRGPCRLSCFSPTRYRVRSMWTAVSTEDKLRVEVEEEELDLKSPEGSLGAVRRRASGRGPRKKGGEVAGEGEEEEIAENSIYTSAEGPSHFTAADVNKFYTLSPEDLEQYFGEGLPSGLLKEFEETKERSLLIRARVLQLCERFQKCLADTLRLKEQREHGDSVRSFASKPRQCLLEGFVKGGKSAALAMLVHWARVQGWLVFYVPHGGEWTSVGMYFKNPETGLWDTPIQARTALEGFLKSHGTLLGEIPCRIRKPLHLGEGAGVGKARGLQYTTLHERATLRDLVEKGLSQSQAAVSSVVRLREELNLVQEVPVLIAIDEFNSWFTFSKYYETAGPLGKSNSFSRRSIHARELAMVNAFRSMEGPLMMATAFSQSLAVGKLPVHLPGVPKGVRFSISRYDFEEARSTLNYYYSRKVASKEPSEEDIKKLFYLTNGNGEELRKLVRLL